MAATVEIGTLISRTPGVCGGRPCIAGTRISVQRIAGWYNAGSIPEEIVRKYGHINLAQVHAALAYYFANKAEIDEYLEIEERLAEQLSQDAGALIPRG
jgi:uncharacterized protein (DUF433 family)